MSEVPRRIATGHDMARMVAGMQERERETKLAAALRGRTGTFAQEFRREGWHNVGDPGEPAFDTSWANNPTGGFNPAGFFKDASGFVHLRGYVWNTAAAPPTTVFTLPAGYRPENHEIMSAIGFVQPALVLTAAYVKVSDTGAVEVYPQQTGSNFWGWVSLDGIDFYAPSG